MKTFSFTVAGACTVFVVLLCTFELLLRTRLYWIYEPRSHIEDYKSRTPPATRTCALDEAVDVDVSSSAATFDAGYYLQPALKEARDISHTT